MHRHRYVHFDLAIANIVTNQQGAYAFIDFELSRKFDNGSHFRALGHRATELPPECECKEYSDPFKVDVWALGVLILRACKVRKTPYLCLVLYLMGPQMTAYHPPELLPLVQTMVLDNPDQRPTACQALEAFNRMLTRTLHHRTRSGCPNHH